MAGEPHAELIATPVVTLGAREGPNALPNGGIVVADGSGRYLAVLVGAQSEIRVFDQSGNFVETIGRSGEGPGEFGRIGTIIPGRADTLFVIDAGLRRITTLAPDGRVMGTVSVPWQLTTVVPLGDSGFALRSWIHTEDRVGYPLHVLNRDGQIETSFGAETPAYRRDRPYRDRRIAPTHDRQAVWSAHEAQYRVERWTATGKLELVIDRRTDWFDPYADLPPQGGVSRTTPPRPRMAQVHEDSSGYLWVAIRMPGRDWQSAVGERIDPQGRRHVGVTDPFRYRQTLIEAIDLDAGQVLGSLRLDDHFVSFVGDRDVLIYREDGAGHPFLDIRRLQLPTLPPVRRP